MSQPRQSSPSHSPTPSKSSLRRTSGPQNSSQRSLLPPPSPRFEEEVIPLRYSPRSPPNQTLEYESEDDELSEGEQNETSFPPLIGNFQPFFTLIEDNLTSEHHHPSVHYIFADDDHEIITEAALRSLEQDEWDSTAEQSQDAILPPPRPGVKEHYLILDVQPVVQQSEVQDEYSTRSSQTFVVSGSRSLSSDWQVLESTISSAPTMGENTDEGLMLRIEGRGLGVDNEAKTREEEHDDRETVEEMIERFQSRLSEVRRLVEMDVHSFSPVEDELEMQD